VKIGVDGTDGTSGVDGTDGTSGVDGEVTGITYNDMFYYDPPVLYTEKLAITSTGTTTSFQIYDVVDNTKYDIFVSGGTLMAQITI